MKKTLWNFNRMVMALSAFFFLASAILFGFLPMPPSQPDALGNWVHQNNLLLVLIDESMIFATMTLIPFVYSFFLRANQGKADAGKLSAGLMGAFVVLMLFADINLGRLIYPVFGLPISSESMAIGLSTAFGALHTADLALGAALFCAFFSPWVAHYPISRILAAGVGVISLITAYPWLTGLFPYACMKIAFPMWLVTVLFEDMRKEKQRMTA